MVILIPKLRNHYAEFLNDGYLEHLRLLASPTCVGFGTGVQYTHQRRFSWKSGISCLYANCLGIASQSNEILDFPGISSYSVHGAATASASLTYSVPPLVS